MDLLVDSDVSTGLLPQVDLGDEASVASGRSSNWLVAVLLWLAAASQARVTVRLEVVLAVAEVLLGLEAAPFTKPASRAFQRDFIDSSGLEVVADVGL